MAITTSRADRSRQMLSLVCLMVAGAMIGVSVNLAKLASAAELTPYAYLAWSVFGAALAHAGIAAYRRELPPLNWRTTEYFVVAGLITLVAPYLINFTAVPEVGASFVALSIAFPPLLTYLGALFLGMERFHAGRALGVALALAGAALLAVLKLSQPDAEIIWIVATLAVPVILAIGNIYRTKRWPGDIKPGSLAPGMLVVSAIILFAAGLLPGFSLDVPLENTTPALLILTQAATFAVMYVFFFILQKVAGPVYLSLLGSVAAVVGAGIAILVLGEAPPPGLATGSVLIALGIALVTRRNRESDGGGAKLGDPRQPIDPKERKVCA